MDTEIRKRIETNLEQQRTTTLAGFLALKVCTLPSRDHRENIRSVIDWLEGRKAYKPTVADINELIKEFEMDDIAVCSNCGKLMTSGYVLDDDHACSERCAVAIYEKEGLDKSALYRDLEEDSKTNRGVVYWTAW